MQERRSIGIYDPNRNVNEEDVIECIKAALYAPSGCNAQPWKFYWIKDKKVRGNIRKKDSLFYQSDFYNSPVWILVTSCPDAYIGKRGAEHQVGENLPSNLKQRSIMFDKERIDTEQNRKLRATRDTSFGVSYFLLMATALGIDTSPVGLIKKEAIRKELHIPENEQIEYAIVMGHRPLGYNVKPKITHSIDNVLVID